MKYQKVMMGLLLMLTVFVLAACGTDNDEKLPEENDEDMEMDHSRSAEVPGNLKESGNPAFAVGDKAIVEADHMKGMKGAEATIVGAYDTTAYVITYKPTTGGDKVKDHKWVIQEEIEDAGDNKLDPGTEVIIEADHMKGMKGAKAEIESAEQTTVYMINYPNNRW